MRQRPLANPRRNGRASSLRHEWLGHARQAVRQRWPEGAAPTIRNCIRSNGGVRRAQGCRTRTVVRVVAGIAATTVPAVRARPLHGSKARVSTMTSRHARSTEKSTSTSIARPARAAIPCSDARSSRPPSVPSSAKAAPLPSSRRSASRYVRAFDALRIRSRYATRGDVVKRAQHAVDDTAGSRTSRSSSSSGAGAYRSASPARRSCSTSVSSVTPARRDRVRAASARSSSSSTSMRPNRPRCSLPRRRAVRMRVIPVRARRDCEPQIRSRSGRRARSAIRRCRRCACPSSSPCQCATVGSPSAFVKLDAHARSARRRSRASGSWKSRCLVVRPGTPGHRPCRSARSASGVGRRPRRRPTPAGIRPGDVQRPR